MRRIGLALLLALGSCSRAAPDPCPEVEASHPVDALLLAFLSRARAAHHAADQVEAANDLPSAIRRLDALVDGPVPAFGTADGAPEVREVLADTLARLADLRGRLGEYDRAEQHIGRGLELAREPSYFRGHLYEIRGRMWERRAAALREHGDESGALHASTVALEALENAMKIQAEVIEKSLAEKDASP